MLPVRLLGFLLLILTLLPRGNGMHDILRTDTTRQPHLTTRSTIIDSLIASSSLREKVGQLFFVPVTGDFTSRDANSFHQITEMVQEAHIGGLIFMKGDVYGQAMMTNKLQKLSKIPLWITQDMEYGAAMRIREATRFTPAMGIAATGDKRNAFMAGKITAIEAKALGVHQIYAPVLDVNNNPDNPVINVRAFSGDPVMVAEFGTSFIAGVRSEGLIATAKHFPGHGDTDTDSHNELPVLNHDYGRLDSVELYPFRKAVEFGVQSVMSAHISFPGISKEPGLPGTLDPDILQSILIDSLQFNGVVVTDGLEMGGISNRYSPGTAVVKAMNAGADVMLISPDVYTAIDEIVAAVEKGDITEDRIDQSFRKILVWKEEHGLLQGTPDVDLEALDTRIATNYHQSVARKIARESITMLKNENNILPIDPERYEDILFLALSDEEDQRTGSSFIRAMRDYHPRIEYRIHDPRTTETEENRYLRKARESDLIVLGSFVGLRFRESIQLTNRQTSFLRKLQATGKPVVLVMFGNPYLVKELSDTDVQIMAWDKSALQMEAAAPALFGATAITGQLPIHIPGLYETGHGLQTTQTTMRYGQPEDVGLSATFLNSIEGILRKAVSDSVFPGAVAGVVKDGVLVYQKAVGYHDYEKLNKVRESDVYDLASITKVAATTLAAMKLVDDQKISLDDKVANYLDEFKQGKKAEVTIGQLLLHESGLTPFRVYVDSLQNRKDLLQAIKDEPLIYDPGTDYRYSDLGMIVLADIIEQVTGQRLDQYARSRFYKPMNMYGAYFNPVRVSRWYVNRIPPTEIDTVYRNKLIQAEVNDERAWYLDGVAGHAGLFATVDDLAKLSTMLLNGGMYEGKRYLSEEVIQLFTSRQARHSERGYGFDRKSSSGFSTAGQLSGTDTFGHLGFTGTSLWIDRGNNMAVILLTNRTFPYRSYGKQISKIRAEVADAAFSAIRE